MLESPDAFFGRLFERQEANATSASLRGPEAFDLEDFLEKSFPPRELLLAPWLPRKGLAMVFAPRGVGKTFFALNVAYAVATAGTFLGWKAEEARRVVLLDGEMPGLLLQQRLRDILSTALNRPDPGMFRIVPFDTFQNGSPPDLSTRAGQLQIEPLIEGADLIIVDNLSTLCRSGKENEAESWSEIQNWLLEQRRKDRSVLLVHHAGKGGKQRGTSRREDVLDTVIGLNRPVDYDPSQGARFRLSFEKARGFYGNEAKEFEAHYKDGAWVVSHCRSAPEDEVCRLKNEGMSYRAIAKEAGISKSQAHRLSKRAAETGT